MEDKHRVFLVTGMFDLTAIGGLRFFEHVRNHLTQSFAELDLDAEIHEVATSPTASIPARAVELLEAIQGTDAAEAGPIHLIGHSAGGLDARMLATPNVSLRTDIDPAAIARRIRTVVTVATPHNGTPLAGYLGSPYGRQLAVLLLLTGVRALATGNLPAAPLYELGSALSGLDHDVELEEAELAQLRAVLAEELSSEMVAAAAALAEKLAGDRSLLDQLTLSGIDLFNAATSDRDTVRYGSVVTSAPQPTLKSVPPTASAQPANASPSLFAVLNRMVSSATTDRYRGHLSGECVELFQRAFGATPSLRDNDGVVPSLSQIWGKTIHAARGDHFEVLGHYDDPDSDPIHRCWLASESDFDEQSFAELWNAVSRFIARDEGEAA